MAAGTAQMSQNGLDVWPEQQADGSDGRRRRTMQWSLGQPVLRSDMANIRCMVLISRWLFATTLTAAF